MSETRPRHRASRRAQAVNLLTQVADISFDEQLDPLQKKFLEKALAYYEKFTSRAAGDSSVKLEHGRAYQQMGDIERKLGRLSRRREVVSPLARVARAAGRRNGCRARSEAGRWPGRAPCWRTSWSAAEPMPGSLTSFTIKHSRPSRCWPTPRKTRPPPPKTACAWARP